MWKNLYAKCEKLTRSAKCEKMYYAKCENNSHEKKLT